jgi:putative Mn2+ efflux pump MntP
MIIDGVKPNEENKIKEYSNKTFFILAIATSIDALAIGVTFAFLNINILSAIFIIGITTFVLSVSAVYLGKVIGNVIKNKAGIFGGLILFIIGLKILLEHLGVIKI